MLTLDRGAVGIGKVIPGKKMEINSATGDCLRLTYNGAADPAVNYADLTVSSTGDLTITPSGADLTVAGNFHLSATYQPVVAADATVATLISAMTTAGWIKAA